MKSCPCLVQPDVMSDQTTLFAPGTLVWAKVLKRVWWPGKIINLSLVPNEIKNSLRLKRKAKAVVFFERDKSYEIIANSDQLFLYNSNKKLEFLEKGYLLYTRQKNNDAVQVKGFDMTNFIEDVCLIEKDLGGDVHIFDQFVEKLQQEQKKIDQVKKTKKLFVSIKEKKKQEREKGYFKRHMDTHKNEESGIENEKISTNKKSTITLRSSKENISTNKKSTITLRSQLVTSKNTDLSVSIIQAQDEAQDDAQDKAQDNDSDSNEDDEPNLPGRTLVPSGIGLSSKKIKNTTNSCSCNASSGCAQSFELQSSVPPVPKSLPCPPTNMYPQLLRMPNDPAPIEHSISAISSDMMTIIKRENVVSLNANMQTNSGSINRSTSTSSPIKCVATNSTIKTPQVSKSLTKSHTSANNSPVIPRQNVNLNSHQKSTINEVDHVNIINHPANITNDLPSTAYLHSTSQENGDIIDLTDTDESCNDNYLTCQICSQRFLSIETLYEHIFSVHKPIMQSHCCNLCSLVFPSEDILNHHKTSFHRVKVNSMTQLVLPILNINQLDIGRLITMGITSYLPVTQLDNLHGNYGVPIMNISQSNSIEHLKYKYFFNLECIHKS